MLTYILRRLLYMIPTLLAISLVAFAVVTLPPGDFVDRLVIEARTDGEVITAPQALRERYGLDRPWVVQYLS